MIDYFALNEVDGLNLHVIHEDGFSVELTVRDDSIEVTLCQWEDDSTERVLGNGCFAVPGARTLAYGRGVLDIFANDTLLKFGNLSVRTDREKVTIQLGRKTVYVLDRPQRITEVGGEREE